MNSWSKYSANKNRQTWKLCLRMFHRIWGQQWDLQALPAIGISVLFVSSLPIIHVRSVEYTFVQTDARRYMMVPVAWNFWPDWSDLSGFFFCRHNNTSPAHFDILELFMDYAILIFNMCGYKQRVTLFSIILCICTSVSLDSVRWPRVYFDSF